MFCNGDSKIVKREGGTMNKGWLSRRRGELKESGDYVGKESLTWSKRREELQRRRV